MSTTTKPNVTRQAMAALQASINKAYQGDRKVTGAEMQAALAVFPKEANSAPLREFLNQVAAQPDIFEADAGFYLRAELGKRYHVAFDANSRYSPLALRMKVDVAESQLGTANAGLLADNALQLWGEAMGGPTLQNLTALQAGLAKLAAPLKTALKEAHQAVKSVRLLQIDPAAYPVPGPARLPQTHRLDLPVLAMRDHVAQALERHSEVMLEVTALVQRATLGDAVAPAELHRTQVLIANIDTQCAAAQHVEGI